MVTRCVYVQHVPLYVRVYQRSMMYLVLVCSPPPGRYQRLSGGCAGGRGSIDRHCLLERADLQSC